MGLLRVARLKMQQLLAGGKVYYGLASSCEFRPPLKLRNSLCKELRIPLCAGQSFGWKLLPCKMIWRCILGLWDPGAGEVRNSDVFAGLSTLQLYVGPRVEAKRKPGLRVICAGMVHA